MDELQKMSDEKDEYAQRCHDLDLQVYLDTLECQVIRKIKTLTKLKRLSLMTIMMITELV